MVIEVPVAQFAKVGRLVMVYTGQIPFGATLLCILEVLLKYLLDTGLSDIFSICYCGLLNISYSVFKSGLWKEKANCCAAFLVMRWKRELQKMQVNDLKC